jgi:mannose-1-phosphate guanylyltransferase
MRYAVILAGGSGARLWPMSRRLLPKQLIPFMDGRSLLRVAWDRLDGLVDGDRRYVCAGDALRGRLLDAVPGLAPDRIIGEPEGRDTLNAVAYACLVLSRRDPDAVVAVLTADHVITPEDSLRDTLRAGFQAVEADPSSLVTFGVAPTHPATGYGYLELGEAGSRGARFVRRFVEKPDARTAAGCVLAGPDRYLWNSGMFVWSAAAFLSCLRRFAPGTAAAFDRMAGAWGTPRFQAAVAEEYPRLPRISVDVAVMEPVCSSGVVPVLAYRLAAEWLDVGSWPSYALTRVKDGAGNASAAARALLVDSRDCLVVSDDEAHVVALLGCEDLVVIHTADATLVCPRGRAEEVKRLRGEAVERFGESLG